MISLYNVMGAIRGAFLGFGCPKRHPAALLAKTMECSPASVVVVPTRQYFPGSLPFTSHTLSPTSPLSTHAHACWIHSLTGNRQRAGHMTTRQFINKCERSDNGVSTSAGIVHNKAFLGLLQVSNVHAKNVFISLSISCLCWKDDCMQIGFKIVHSSILLREGTR